MADKNEAAIEARLIAKVNAINAQRAQTDGGQSSNVPTGKETRLAEIAASMKQFNVNKGYTRG